MFLGLAFSYRLRPKFFADLEEQPFAIGVVDAESLGRQGDSAVLGYGFGKQIDHALAAFELLPAIAASISVWIGGIDKALGHLATISAEHGALHERRNVYAASGDVTVATGQPSSDNLSCIAF